MCQGTGQHAGHGVGSPDSPPTVTSKNALMLQITKFRGWNDTFAKVLTFFLTRFVQFVMNLHPFCNKFVQFVMPFFAENAYLCTRIAARTGCTSAKSELSALGLHRPCRRKHKNIEEYETTSTKQIHFPGGRDAAHSNHGLRRSADGGGGDYRRRQRHVRRQPVVDADRERRGHRHLG